MGTRRPGTAAHRAKHGVHQSPLQAWHRVFVAPRLLPDRSTPLTDASRRVFTAQLRIRKDSLAEGMTLSAAVARAGGDMRVLRVRRLNGVYVVTFPDLVLRADDRLVLSDTPVNLKRFEDALGGTLYSGDTVIDASHPITAEDQQTSEVVVVEGSSLEGASIRELRFIDRYQLVVLALHRGGKEILTPGQNMQDVELQAGDVLLVQGSAEAIADFATAIDSAPLATRSINLFDGRIVDETRNQPVARAAGAGAA